MKELSINLIVGLPGSGKTHLAWDIGGYVVDDIKDMSDLPDTIEHDTWTITDPNFCNAKTIEIAKSQLKHHAKGLGYSNVVFNIHYFENNPDQCRKNVRYRNDGREVEATIRKYEKIYKPPYWAKKVWECPE